jgi:hypothetical protein
MRIDVHAHYWTEDYIDLLVDLGQAGAVMARGLSRPGESPGSGDDLSPCRQQAWNPPPIGWLRRST